MKVQLKKVLALVLIFCLLLSAVPVAAVETVTTEAQPQVESQPVSVESADPAAAATSAAPVTSSEVTVVREEESLRGEYEKHFLMSDGSYQAVVYSYPVHELVNGVWVELPIPEQTARGEVSPGNAQQNIIDNYVWQNHGVQDNNSVRLYIGKRSGNECRAFIRFATMPTIPAGATITAATMKVNIVSGTSTAYNAKASQVTGSWESATIQWSNMPGNGGLLEDNISHNNKTKYEFSCLAAVRHWYDGSTTGQNENYGIMLQYADSTIADYNSFYSADCTDATMRPSMTISYQPLNSDIRLDVGNRVTLSVTGATGVVTWTSSNTSIATVNPYGLVTGIQVGEATITAYVGGLEFKKFTVSVTIADGVYRIANTAGLNLATYGGIAENTSVKMRSYSDSGFEELCQLWKIAYLGNGYYSIRPMHKLDMGLHAGGTMGSSVDIVSIGTSDTLSNVAPLGRWGISPTADGSSYFINHVGTGSLGMTMDGLYPSVGMGVITDASSDTQGFFKWALVEEEDPPSGAILYDTFTNKPNTCSRYISVGETKSLSDLNLLPVSYSGTIMTTEFKWESTDSCVTVNYDTGAITGVSAGTATITGSYSINGSYHFVSYTTEVSKLLIYQTKNTYYHDADGNYAEDLICGDMSEDDLRALEWVSWADFMGYTPVMHMGEWEVMCTTLFSTGELRTVIKDMIYHFIAGSGTPYSNTILTQNVYEHNSTQEYIENVEEQLELLLNTYGGNISTLAYAATNRDSNPLVQALKANGVNQPVYNTVADTRNGLRICIDGLWGNKIEVSSYNISGNSYLCTLHYTLYDHFGLDQADVEEFGYLPGFRSWYVLQHYSEYNSAYKPFLTVIEFDVTISGTIS